MFGSFGAVLQQNAALKREKMASLEDIARMQIAGREDVARIGASGHGDFEIGRESGQMARAELAAEIDRERMGFEKAARGKELGLERSRFYQDVLDSEALAKRRKKEIELYGRYGGGMTNDSLGFGFSSGQGGRNPWAQWDLP